MPAAIEANTDCIIKLPAPGSRYAYASLNQIRPKNIAHIFTNHPPFFLLLMFIYQKSHPEH